MRCAFRGAGKRVRFRDAQRRSIRGPLRTTLQKTASTRNRAHFPVSKRSPVGGSRGPVAGQATHEVVKVGFRPLYPAGCLYQRLRRQEQRTRSERHTACSPPALGMPEGPALVCLIAFGLFLYSMRPNRRISIERSHRASMPVCCLALPGHRTRRGFRSRRNARGTYAAGQPRCCRPAPPAAQRRAGPPGGNAGRVGACRGLAAGGPAAYVPRSRVLRIPRTQRHHRGGGLERYEDRRTLQQPKRPKGRRLSA